MLPRVTGLEHLVDYRLRLSFSDGVEGEVDLKPRIAGRGGVFAPLQDPEFFSRVQVEPQAGTIMWPNGVDLCPDVLYSLTTGKPVPFAEPVVRR